MSWLQLENYIKQMKDSEKQQTVLVFDYDTNSFKQVSLNFEGEPKYHLQIN